MALRIARAGALCAVALATAGSGAAFAQTAASTQGPDPIQVAQAQPQSPPKPAVVQILDELKLGLLAHDVGLFGHHKEKGFDTNLEILFASPNIFRYIWSPRPHFGADINAYGKTSSYYAGLTWGGVFYKPGWSPDRDDGFFAFLAVGGAVNDGKISTTDPHRKSLGSHELFREGLDIGYSLNAMVSVSGFIDHISNANLANRNEGLTNAGARIGLKF
jgi:lipid A 3-O-deacylase